MGSQKEMELQLCADRARNSDLQNNNRLSALLEEKERIQWVKEESRSPTPTFHISHVRLRTFSRGTTASSFRQNSSPILYGSPSIVSVDPNEIDDLILDPQ